MPVTIHQAQEGVWTALDGMQQPPSTQVTYPIGAAVYLSTDSSYTFAVADGEYGPMSLRRSYDDESVGIPASWDTSAAGSDTGKRHSVWSCKPGITSMGNGTLDAALANFIATIPDDGWVKWLCCWHEPDAKIRRGQFTVSEWVQAHRRFANVVHDAGRDDVRVTAIWTTWIWDPRNSEGPDPQTLWPGSSYVDVLGLDGYTDDATQTQADHFAAGQAFAAEQGVPWGVGEVGLMTHGGDEAQWVTDGADWAAGANTDGGPVSYYAWFDSDVGGVVPTPGDTQAMTSAAADAVAAYSSKQEN